MQMLFAVLDHNKRAFSLNTEKHYVLIKIKVFCIACIFAVKYDIFYLHGNAPHFPAHWISKNMREAGSEFEWFCRG
jgi:hypothetical protein